MPSTKPAAEHCLLPSCGTLVEPKRVAGIWEFTCPMPHAMKWTWDGDLGAEPKPFGQQSKPLTAAQKKKREKDAVTDNLLSPFRRFFETEHRLVEHGVIEDWLRTHYFEIYRQHIDEVGHRLFGKPAHRQTTASNNRFKIALLRLHKEGLIKNRRLPSTGGGWAHDSEISFWHRADTAPTQTITWAEHRAQQGKQDDWTDDDRSGLNPPQ
jgi:hypothetical protein